MRIQALRASETLYKSGDRSFDADYRSLSKDSDVDVVIQAMLTMYGLKVADLSSLVKTVAENSKARGVQFVAERIVNAAKGTIHTPMVEDMIAKGELDIPEAEANQPIGRLGRGDEIAAAVLWLCSPGASFVLGVALPVDGGYTAH